MKKKRVFRVEMWAGKAFRGSPNDFAKGCKRGLIRLSYDVKKGLSKGCNMSLARAFGLPRILCQGYFASALYGFSHVSKMSLPRV